MHRKVLLVFLILLVALLTAACFPGLPPLVSDQYAQDTSLIDGDPCAAPCWNGIIPGETSWQDALDVLNTTPDVVGLQENTVDVEGSDEQVVVADWGQVESGEYCCRVLADSADEAVRYIFLRLAPNIVLDELIEAHGEPDYTQYLLYTESEGVLQMIYTDVPMVVWALVGDPAGEVLVNTPIVAAIYITPDEMDFLVEVSTLGPWLGYAPFQDYVDAAPAVTPSVTLTPGGASDSGGGEGS